MKEGWIKVFTAGELFQAQIARDVLKQNGIESHIPNRPDSMFPSVEEAELYTLPEKAQQAIAVLKANDILKD